MYIRTTNESHKSICPPTGRLAIYFPCVYWPTLLFQIVPALSYRMDHHPTVNMDYELQYISGSIC